MKLGTATVVERYQRAGTMQRVALRTNFIINGTYQEPYAVSSVALFKKESNVSPSSVLDNSGLVSGTPLYLWEGDADASSYDGSLAMASSVYSVDDGRKVVVLDGVNSAAGDLAAGRYIEIWTVKMASLSDWKTYINEFELFQDSVINTTEDVLLRTKTRLTPNQVRLGEVVDLKVGCETTVQNKGISQNIRNIFNQTVVDNPQMRIRKHNEDSNLPAWVDVSGFSDTEDLVSITSDNTMVFRFDTSVLSSGITNLGSARGVYSVEAKYNVLGETIISPMMHFTVR